MLLQVTAGYCRLLAHRTAWTDYSRVSCFEDENLNRNTSNAINKLMFG